ncbi:efflux RND transporter periplasmic adaptor subunit [Ketobacter sp. MCCC 1A13808]|uniref:efflux RND transporter periplasmic adaptor subunit n=1 Tax=Ketobacter sp. MCCC 1A13808 TaxID=2602738 RepID=UPI000F1210F6|nr:efflux RND transporter periplasmic adaptor subunit [Ketobacter sp. MCCC 1A13808]MVF12540.1 efflux RND transporter periplasmic adaptor subunit [Ketobacter sp. MCCC 1A13808]RLP55657.1 MAG: efflux RND transporter periplasmic adaptor subunit [Ketobacter sp.]
MNRALKIALPVMAIIVAVLVSIILFSSRPEVEHKELHIKAPLVTVTTVQAESLSIPVFTRGTVTPGTEIQLISEVSGQVLELSPHFANGGFFRKDEVLVRVDPVEYEVNIKRAEASKAQAYQVKLQAEAEKKARSRIKSTNSSQLANYEVQYLQAKAQYDAAVAELEAVKLQKARTTIRAPFDGRVRIAALNIGQYVRPGQQMGAIYAVDVAEVRLPLSDRQLSLVDVPTRFQDSVDKEFPTVTLSETFAGRTYTWKGEVVRAEGGVDERNRLLYVVARVNDPYGADPNQPGRPELVAGSFVEATIDGRKFDGIYQVPRKALRNGAQIWVVSDDNRLKEKEVAIIYKSKDHVYVSSGLQDGEQVVLSQMDIAVDGMKVRTQRSEDFNYETQPEQNTAFDDLNVSVPPATTGKEINIPDLNDPRVKKAAEQAKAHYDGLSQQQKAQVESSVEGVVEQAKNLQQAITQKKPESDVVEAEPETVAPPVENDTGMSPFAAQLEADIASQQKPEQETPEQPAASGQQTADQQEPDQPVSEQVQAEQDTAEQSAPEGTSDNSPGKITISTVAAPEPLVEARQ